MKTRKKGLGIAVWILVAVLFVCAAGSTAAYFDVMKTYIPNDDGAISLRQPAPNDDTVGASQPPESVDMGSSPDSDKTENNTEIGDGSAEESLKVPGFEISDSEKVWSTNTKVEIFRVEYENGEGVVTVQSSDCSKVIAPGTESSYVFKLKNAGDVALDYKVELNVYVEPDSVRIPVIARLSRYDGEWVAGSNESFVSAELLDEAEDDAVLGSGKYTYYTLEWCWPFEGDDVSDTALGDLAAESDISFTIEIITTATADEDPEAEGGITPPPTGDDTRFSMWVIITLSALVLVAVVFVIDKKQNRHGVTQEAETVEADRE